MNREQIKKRFFESLELHGYNTEGITEESSFVDDFAFDSLDNIECLIYTEEEFDISIPDEEAEKVVKVKDAIDLIEKKLS